MGSNPSGGPPAVNPPPLPLPEVLTQVLVVGSGPVGATYASKLVKAGIQVLMVEIGAQERPIPGDHKKNNYIIQKDINSFINVVNGELDKLSIPVDKQIVPTLEPVSWSIDPFKGTIANGQNPFQDQYENLPAASATRAVGGMSNHWTCATPRQHPIERSTIFTPEEWDGLYTEAEGLVKTTDQAFEDSIRQQLVKRTLASFTYPRGPREFKSLPLAVEKRADLTYFTWSSSATIFGDITQTPDRKANPLFTLKSQCRCTHLRRNGLTGEIEGAEIRDLQTGQDFVVIAKKYVICAGAILTPGILHNSGYTTDILPALGHYLTEQTMTFCQIVLDSSLVQEVPSDPFNLGWKVKVANHYAEDPNDPLPFPFDDYDPQVYTPFSDAYPWHTQIHRDAFSYGAVPPDVDQRVIVDFRWFGYIKPVFGNFVEFGLGPNGGIKDQFGMPQPTFHYKVPDEDAQRTHEMMADMVNVASKLGGWLPGAEPKFLVPGSALHIGGTTRAGYSKADSVVDKNSKVWGVDNLYLGGCNVIPTGYATNPTLTAICFAIVGANDIIKSFTPQNPTKS